MQQTFPCPKCGTHNIIGVPSCQGCGENFKYTCSHCGVMVDTRLKSCSECGASLDWPIHNQPKPQTARKKRNPVLIVALIIVAVSLLAGLAMSFVFQIPLFTSSPGTSPQESGPAPVTTGAIEVTAEELLQIYRIDREAAEAEYKGKILKVTGVIGSAGKNFVGTLFVKLAGDSIEAWRVMCIFDKEHEPEMAQVMKGQTVTVQGECDDYLPPDAVLKDCSLIK